MGSSMLKQTSAWLLFLLVIAMLPLLAPAQASASAPSPGLDCTSTLVTLLPCLDFVQGNVSTPPKNCCLALSGVVNSNPICLCTLFTGNNSFGIVINVTDALSLPTLCKVVTPPPSTCSAVGYPVPASLAGPTPPVLPPSPLSTPSASPTPTSGVPATSPAPASVTSAPAPTTASPSPTTASPSAGSPGSSTSSPGSSTPPPPSTPAPSPSATGELPVSTAMCFVALLAAGLQMVM